MLLKKDPDKLPCTTWDELTFSGYLWQFIFDKLEQTKWTWSSYFRPMIRTTQDSISEYDSYF